MWWWHQHSFISRFRNTIGWRLSHQEPDQHPPTVKYVRKNSKVRPRQRHWDGSLSNFHLLEDQRLCWGPTHLCSSCLQTEKATDGATGKTKKEHSKNIQTKTCWWYNPIIWTSDWLSEAAEVWDFPCCFVFNRGKRCFHTYCSDTSDQVCFTTKQFYEPNYRDDRHVEFNKIQFPVFFSFASVVYCQTCWEEQMSWKWKCALIS